MTQQVISVPLKSVGTAYLWWFFLGGLGAHKFYLNRPGMGILYALTFGLLLVGVLVDLFTLPRQTRRANAKIIAEARRLYSDRELDTPTLRQAA